jgi:hypothetical protein
MYRRCQLCCLVDDIANHTHVVFPEAAMKMDRQSKRERVEGLLFLLKTTAVDESYA